MWLQIAHIIKLNYLCIYIVSTLVEINQLFDPLLLQENQILYQSNIAPVYMNETDYYGLQTKSLGVQQQYDNVSCQENDGLSPSRILANLDNNKPVLNIEVNLIKNHHTQMPQQNILPVMNSWHGAPNCSFVPKQQQPMNVHSQMSIDQKVVQSQSAKGKLVSTADGNEQIPSNLQNIQPLFNIQPASSESFSKENEQFAQNCLNDLNTNDLLTPSLDIIDFTTVLENMSGSLNSMQISF